VVPSVAVTMPWVSPRVNSDEPWGRGSQPTSQVIGRTVVVSRPSMRTRSSVIIVRITLPWTSPKASLTSPSWPGNSGPSSATTRDLMALNFA
jgi:hypothetical protein